jgi:hypothetical protein
MNVNGQLPVPVVLPPEKMPPVATELEAGEGKGCSTGGLGDVGEGIKLFSLAGTQL